MNRRGALVLLTSGLLVVGGAVWRYASVGSSDVEVVVLQVAGGVTLDGTKGQHAARVGTVLAAGDRVQTGDDGKAVLQIGNKSQVQISPRSDVVVRGVDAEGVQLTLAKGRMHATVHPEDGGLRVAAGKQELLALSADFDVGVAEGLVQVRTDRGSVAISGADLDAVTQGTEANFVGRHGTVGPVPTELLLDVPWPERSPTRDGTATVEGRTIAGATVRITGRFPGEVVAVADARGQFSAVVPLVEGSNGVVVVATDALGRERKVDGVVANRDTTGPAFHGGAVYER